jgi:hypothetical protein
MDTKRHELLVILGHALAQVVDLHERQGRATLDAPQRAAQPLPLAEWAADRIEEWARSPDATRPAS